MTLRLAHIEVDNYYAEYICLAITVVFIGKALVKSEEGKPREEAQGIGFKKVLAAHSFSWVGVHSMFVYMFAYVQDTLPELSDIDMGRVVSISFLVLNAVAAVLPAFVLEPITEKIGRVKTHMYCIAIMAAGYAGMLFIGTSTMTIYVLMAVLGVGWAAIVSLPFAIMSTKVDQAKMGLYMGLFNLSVVLPQLLASLGIGLLISRAEDKSVLFIISTITLAVSAIAWGLVKEDEEEGSSEAMPGGGGH